MIRNQKILNNVVQRHILKQATLDAIRESKKYKTANARYMREQISVAVLEVIANQMFLKTAFISNLTGLYEKAKNTLKGIYENLQKGDLKAVLSNFMELPDYKKTFEAWLKNLIESIPFINILYKVSKLEYKKLQEWLEELYEKLPEKLQKGLEKLKSISVNIKTFIGEIWGMLKEKIKETDSKIINIVIFLMFLGIQYKLDANLTEHKEVSYIKGIKGEIPSADLLEDLSGDKIADFIQVLLEDVINLGDLLKYKTLPFQIFFLYQEGYLDQELKILRLKK